MRAEKGLKAIAIVWIEARKYAVDDPRYSGYCWAVNEVLRFASDQPGMLWEVILLILNRDQSEKTVRSVGAGPLEDLLIYHGGSYIDKVIERMKKDMTLKIAAKSTDITDADEKVREMFYGNLT